MKFAFHYYTCTLPRQIDCPPVGRESDKKSLCPGCIQWEARFVERSVPVDFDTADYRLRGYGDRPGVRFIDDISRNLSKKIAADRSVRQAKSFRELWKFPHDYGLLHIDGAEKSDALLVTPTMGGVGVVQESTTGREYRSFLHYSSGLHAGLAYNDDASAVVSAESSRALVPAALTEPAQIPKPAIFWNVETRGPGSSPPNQSPSSRRIIENRKDFEVIFRLDRLRGDPMLSGELSPEGTVRKWIQDRRQAVDGKLSVTVILLTDNHVEFRSDRGHVRRSELNLDQLQKYLSNDPSWDRKPFLEVEFELIAKRPGTVPMTVALWDDRGRPLDDFRTAAICIEKCSETVPLLPGSLGLDSVRAASPDSTPPDLSIQVVQVGDAVRGMLYQRGLKACEDADNDTGYCDWSIASSLKEFTTLVESAADDFAKAVDDVNDPGRGPAARLAAAKKLRRALFPDNANAERAQIVFNTFLKDRTPSPPRAADARTIFVRTLGVSGSSFPAVPIALYPLSDEATADELNYAGFSFRIESPLEI